MKELAGLPHGTPVIWKSQGSNQTKGYVVDLTKSKKKHEPPLTYIQWEDGQRTDGRDNAALEYCERID